MDQRALPARYMAPEGLGRPPAGSRVTANTSTFSTPANGEPAEGHDLAFRGANDSQDLLLAGDLGSEGRHISGPRAQLAVEGIERPTEIANEERGGSQGRGPGKPPRGDAVDQRHAGLG